jgi:predicted secreted hydrolase
MSNNSELLANYFVKIRDNPVSLVPYSPHALSVLSAWISSATPSPSALFASMALGGPQSSQGWSTVKPGPFDFPLDHGPHWDIRNEWYYLACNLTYTDSKGATNPLYLLLAIIRRGTSPDNHSPQAQIVACEFTMELPGTSTPYITQSTAFDGFTSNIVMQAPSSTLDFQWSVFDENQLFGLNTPASASDADSLSAFNVGVTYTDPNLGPVTCQLNLVSTVQPPFFLQGDNGCAPCLDGVGYRYYSWPALTVQVGSTVTVGKATYSVQGQAWLDHQWGSRMQPLGYVDNLYLRALAILGNSYPKQLAPQWDWFFMHLSNGTHITTAVLPSQGFLNQGDSVPLTNTTFITTDSGNLSSNTFQGGTVTYKGWQQVNCNWYASSWVLQWPNVTLNLVATQAGSTAGFSKGVDGQSFMEKGVTVTGTVNGVAVTGTGFAEAVGYDPLETQLTELLVTLFGDVSRAQQYVPTFMPASASAGDVALASLLVVGPPLALLIIIITVTAVVLVKKAKKKKLGV